ncbi:MAG: hypothetical protein OQL19_09700 [Gammaproteobacteria bacterium]|nr:hypothetical protein [Gammaproteobacteria bacterium]
MNELTEIYKKWLDNANLDINVAYGENGATITLTFYVIGTYNKVVFTCNRLSLFNVAQPPDEFPMYAVFETNITLKKKDNLKDMLHSDFFDELENNLWHVNVSEGDARINIICEHLTWKTEKITEEELKWLQ